MPRYYVPSTESAWPPAAGFRSDAQSVHASRTLMLADLAVLLDAVPAGADHATYRRAVQDDNVLGKRTSSTRLWAYKKLRELYALDPAVPVFSELRARWDCGAEGRPLLALLAGMARDSLLRASAPAIAVTRPGEAVTRDVLRSAVVVARGERFSDETIKAVVSHLATSWTESGHLAGVKYKVRARATATPAASAYALALGYLAGVRGARLFDTPWTSVLDASAATVRDHAREAARRGWLNYRGIEDIVELEFPHLRANTPPAQFA